QYGEVASDLYRRGIASGGDLRSSVQDGHAGDVVGEVAVRVDRAERDGAHGVAVVEAEPGQVGPGQGGLRAGDFAEHAVAVDVPEILGHRDVLARDDRRGDRCAERQCAALGHRVVA